MSTVSGTVTFKDLFDHEFMAKYTKVMSIDEFFEKGGLPSSPPEYAELSIEILDQVTKELTTFKTWEEMKKQAGTIYLKKKLRERGLT